MCHIGTCIYSFPPTVPNSAFCCSPHERRNKELSQHKHQNIVVPFNYLPDIWVCVPGLLTLGVHAQRGLQYLLCVPVYLSVTAPAANRSFQPATNGIYGISIKSYGEKKAICKLVIAHHEPFSRTFWTNETQELLQAQSVGPCFRC